MNQELLDGIGGRRAGGEASSVASRGKRETRMGKISIPHSAIKKAILVIWGVAAGSHEKGAATPGNPAMWDYCRAENRERRWRRRK